MWINFFLLPFFLLPFVVRWLLWLNILQKKEYRLDRLFSYLKTNEGQREMLAVFPRKGSFSRQTLKRPKFTLRVSLIALLSLFILTAVIIRGIQHSFLIFFLLLLVLLVLTPDIILICSLPFLLMFHLMVEILLLLAQLKLKQTKPLIIGITGSYGKSSTKHLLTHLLSAKDKVFTTQYSYNTPFSLAMQILSRYRGEETVVLEFAAYKIGEIRNLTKRFQPKIAIITGLAPQHLATFGSIENIIKAKAELIEALPSDGVVFYNDTDQGAKKIVDHGLFSKPNLKTYSFSASSLKLDYSEQSIDELAQLTFLLNKKRVKTKIVGKQFFSVIKGAVAVSRYLDLSDQQLVDSLSSFEPNDLFIKFYRHKNGFWILDDGKTANPAGFKAAVELLNEISQKRSFSGELILITSGLIDLGQDSVKIHQQLAQQTKNIFDTVIYLGDAGREQFQEVFGKKMTTDLTQAKKLINEFNKDDIVLVEGRLPVEIAKLLGVKQ